MTEYLDTLVSSLDEDLPTDDLIGYIDTVCRRALENDGASPQRKYTIYRNADEEDDSRTELVRLGGWVRLGSVTARNSVQAMVNARKAGICRNGEGCFAVVAEKPPK